MESLVSFYFSEVNQYYFLVEEYYFRDLLGRWFGDLSAGSAKYLDADEVSRELRYFPPMLFQVLALAVQFLSFEAPAFKMLSQKNLVLCHNYSDTGIELLNSLESQGSTVTVVQTHLLRSAWLKNMGRGVDAWHSIGNAIRYMFSLLCQPDDLTIVCQIGSRNWPPSVERSPAARVSK